MEKDIRNMANLRHILPHIVYIKCTTYYRKYFQEKKPARKIIKKQEWRKVAHSLGTPSALSPEENLKIQFAKPAFFFIYC